MSNDKGTSVLANLTAQVMDSMGSKQAAATRVLTPVAGEAPPPAVHVPDVPGDFLTHEGLAMIEKNLRRDAAAMLKIADGIATVIASGDAAPVIEGKGAGAVLTTEAAQKQREFEADLRAKERAAQDATFPAPEADAETEPIAIAEPEFGWVCPDHGKATEKTAPSGKVYVGCPDCNKFKR